MGMIDRSHLGGGGVTTERPFGATVFETNLAGRFIHQEMIRERGDFLLKVVGAWFRYCFVETVFKSSVFDAPKCHQLNLTLSGGLLKNCRP